MGHIAFISIFIGTRMYFYSDLKRKVYKCYEHIEKN